MTVFLVLVLLLMTVVLPVVLPQEPLWAAWLGPAIMAAILGIVALFSVRGYAVRHESLYIQRLLWGTEIPLRGLKRAFADPDAFKRSWRKAGNGGFLGYTGWFWNKRLGAFRAYITDPARCVVLELENRKIVVSPDNPVGFVKALGFSASAEGSAL